MQTHFGTDRCSSLTFLKFNTMTFAEAMGHLGAFLSCITFMPQVWKTWKTKKAGDLSLTMLLIVVTSTVVWLIYGFESWLWPVIIANTVVFTLSLLLVIFKLTFKE